MTTVSIHQPQYLPYLGFFHKIAHSDIFVVLDDVQYQRRGVQNRNKIKTGSGWQWLTVPIFYHSGQQMIQDVLINNMSNWKRDHWKALVFNYSPTPFFRKYSDKLQAVLEQDYKTLSQLNMALTETILDFLEISIPIFYSSQLETVGNKTQRLVSICQAVGADCYLSGPGGRKYMDLDLFARTDITVQWQQFAPPVYEQHFPEVGFIPNLSIVDVLFNCGPATNQFLQSY